MMMMMMMNIDDDDESFVKTMIPDSCHTTI